jgi:hypothetical protein
MPALSQEEITNLLNNIAHIKSLIYEFKQSAEILKLPYDSPEYRAFVTEQEDQLLEIQKRIDAASNAEIETAEKDTSEIVDAKSAEDKKLNRYSADSTNNLFELLRKANFESDSLSLRYRVRIIDRVNQIRIAQIEAKMAAERGAEIETADEVMTKGSEPEDTNPAEDPKSCCGHICSERGGRAPCPRDMMDQLEDLNDWDIGLEVYLASAKNLYDQVCHMKILGTRWFKKVQNIVKEEHHEGVKGEIQKTVSEAYGKDVESEDLDDRSGNSVEEGVKGGDWEDGHPGNLEVFDCGRCGGLCVRLIGSRADCECGE